MGGERALKAVQVQALPTVTLGERDLEDPRACFGDPVEERRRDGRADDHRVARTGDSAQQFHHADSDVGHRRDRRASMSQLQRRAAKADTAWPRPGTAMA